MEKNALNTSDLLENVEKLKKKDKLFDDLQGWSLRRRNTEIKQNSPKNEEKNISLEQMVERFCSKGHMLVFKNESSGEDTEILICSACNDEIKNNCYYFGEKCNVETCDNCILDNKRAEASMAEDHR